MRAVIALLAVALAVVAYRLLHDDLQQEVVRSLPAGVIGLTAVAAGLIAWGRPRSKRIGMLMAALGFAVLVRPWQYSHEPAVFTLGFLLSELNLALFAHVTLAYPSGRATDRFERWFVGAGYAIALLFPFATLLVYDGSAPLNYVPPGTESVIQVASSDDAVEFLQKTFVILAYGLMAAIFVGLAVRKFARATHLMRRILLPLLLAAVVAAMRALS